MRQARRRLPAVLLAAMLFITLLPMNALADPGDDEGSLAPLAETEGDAAGEIALCEELGSIEEQKTLCRVSFACEPAGTRVTVYDPARCDENGDDLRIEPEEDGTWLLERGAYCFSASSCGYEPVEKAPFFTGGEREKTIDLTLLRLEPLPGNNGGNAPNYEPAYPLPAMTGDIAADTASVAQSQLGYTYSDGTVYGAWWTGVTDWGWDYTRDAWCAMFACWCAYQAGAGMDRAYDKYGANADLLMNWQLEHASGDKSFSTDPQAGDFLFFGDTDGKAEHVAIVTAYDANAKRVNFVGGNQGSPSAVSGSSVSWRQDSYWGAQIVLGYGRPNYAALGAAPIGRLGTANGGAGLIHVSGWAFDPDEPGSPVKIHLCVGSPLENAAVIYEFPAEDPWEGLEAEYPEAGPNHGFSKTISLEDRGTLTLYFYACDLSGSHPDSLFATAEVTVSPPMLVFYTVSYDANGGTGAPEYQVKNHDLPLTLSTVQPTREEASASCTVTLDPNGGSVSSTSLTAAQTTSFTFREWNTAADGSGTAYAPGASYTVNEGATLFAQWNRSTDTETVTLPEPRRTGYRFRGWAADREAVSGATGSYTPDGDVTLYAIWEKDPSVLVGDVNGDGKLNLVDLIRLRRHLAGEQVELNEACTDLDSDGALTSRDLICLRKLLVGAAGS